MAKTAYKQVIEYINQSPYKFIKGIDKITPIIETRYNNDLPKVTDPVEFLKRPVRYMFTIYVKGKFAQPCHVFIYDDKKEAETSYKFYMKHWIDEQIEPYKRKFKFRQRLSISDIEKCKQIQDLLPED